MIATQDFHSADQALRGARALLVEDESIVAMLLEDFLMELGCTVVGAVARIEDALRIAREEQLDIAILDVNIGGYATYPVADILLERQIPFVFATGYGAGGLQERYRSCVALQKPFEMDELAEALISALRTPDCGKTDPAA